MAHLFIEQLPVSGCVFTTNIHASMTWGQSSWRQSSLCVVPCDNENYLDVLGSAGIKGDRISGL